MGVWFPFQNDDKIESSWLSQSSRERRQQRNRQNHLLEVVLTNGGTKERARAKDKTYERRPKRWRSLKRDRRNDQERNGESKLLNCTGAIPRVLWPNNNALCQRKSKQTSTLSVCRFRGVVNYHFSGLRYEMWHYELTGQKIWRNGGWSRKLKDLGSHPCCRPWNRWQGPSMQLHCVRR